MRTQEHGRKLALQKETLRTLTQSNLEQIGGGLSLSTFVEILTQISISGPVPTQPIEV